MSQGKVVQIIGAVVDLEFPQDAVPKVYDALKVTDGGLEGLILEVPTYLPFWLAQPSFGAVEPEDE